MNESTDPTWNDILKSMASSAASLLPFGLLLTATCYVAYSSRQPEIDDLKNKLAAELKKATVADISVGSFEQTINLSDTALNRMQRYKIEKNFTSVEDAVNDLILKSVSSQKAVQKR